MKKRTLIVLMIMAVITALCFTACGKKADPTLEQYCKDNPEIQQNIDEATAGTNVIVTITGNDINYDFDLSTMEGYTEEAVKSDAVKEALDSALTNAGPTFGNISKSIEDETKIEGINVKVNYKWGDEVIVTKTFTSADAEAAAEEAPADAAEEAAEEAEESTEGE